MESLIKMNLGEHGTDAVRISIGPKLDADVVVVGAGPAGAATAAHLARAGWQVLVIDRQSFPRDKVCGDFVGPTALLELEALGVSQRPGYLATNVIRRAALYADGKELITRLFPALEGLPDYGRCIPRLTLDAWLLDAARVAGAQIVEGMSVLGYHVGDDAATLRVKTREGERTLRTQLIIGADGSSSTIARELRCGPPPAASRIIAVRAYYTGDVGPEDQADLYFAAESFPGYYWLFPTGKGTANVGVGMVLETYPPTSNHLRDTMLRLVEHDPALSRRLRHGRITGKIVGWPLSTYDPSLPVFDDRVLLIGDAAGFINPLNGEGIQYALLSGRWAAEQAAMALEGADLSRRNLQPYSDRVRRELRYDMAFAGMIVECIRNRHLNVFWLKLLHVITARARVDNRYAEICGAVLAGLVPSHRALTPHIIGRTIDQAIYSAILAAGWTTLQGPRQLLTETAHGVEHVRDVAFALAQDPVGMLQWFVGVARQGCELAIETTLSGVRPSNERYAPAPFPAAGPRTICLQIPLDHV